MRGTELQNCLTSRTSRSRQRLDQEIAAVTMHVKSTAMTAAVGELNC